MIKETPEQREVTRARILNEFSLEKKLTYMKWCQEMKDAACAMMPSLSNDEAEPPDATYITQMFADGLLPLDAAVQYLHEVFAFVADTSLVPVAKPASDLANKVGTVEKLLDLLEAITKKKDGDWYETVLDKLRAAKPEMFFTKPNGQQGITEGYKLDTELLASLCTSDVDEEDATAHYLFAKFGIGKSILHAVNDAQAAYIAEFRELLTAQYEILPVADSEKVDFELLEACHRDGANTQECVNNYVKVHPALFKALPTTAPTA
jgi:hypothetical protein